MKIIISLASASAELNFTNKLTHCPDDLGRKVIF